MIEHRKELRSRVEHRQKLLQTALSASEKAGHLSDRISALNTELSVVSDAVSGGWEKMTDTTAERLSAWLTATKNLVQDEKEKGVGKVTPPPSLDPLVQEVSASSEKTN